MRFLEERGGFIWIEEREFVWDFSEVIENDGWIKILFGDNFGFMIVYLILWCFLFYYLFNSFCNNF